MKNNPGHAIGMTGRAFLLRPLKVIHQPRFNAGSELDIISFIDE
jgi:hypothetical protein